MKSRIIYVSPSLCPMKNYYEIAYMASSALLISHDIRRDTVFIYGPILRLRRGYLVIYGFEVRNLRPDIESSTPLIIKALEGKTRRGIVFKDHIIVKADVMLVYKGYGLQLEQAIDKISKSKARSIALALAANDTEPLEIIKSRDIVNFTLTPNIYNCSQIITIFHYLLDSKGWG